MTDSRIFFNWNQPPLDCAARWILEESNLDLNNTTIALPGRRALRGLEERLAAKPGCGTPNLVSIGQLNDQIVKSLLPRASGMTRLLCWTRALQKLTPQDLQAITAQPYPNKGILHWMPLAQLLRRLHGDLAAEGLLFRDVLDQDVLPIDKEIQRWKALQLIQADYLEQLEALEVGDPHCLRMQALQDGSFEQPRNIVLVGVLDLNGLQRRAISESDWEVNSLVFAPEDTKDGFCDLGTINPTYWANKERTFPLDDSDWTIANKPADQAWAAIQHLSQVERPLTAEDITLALADESIISAIEQQFHNQSIPTHNAVGTSMRDTGPWRLLDALGKWMASGLAKDAYAFLRHPDLIETGLGDELTKDLNRNHEQALPKYLSSKHPNAAIQNALNKVEELLGMQIQKHQSTLPLEEGLELIGVFLSRVWAQRPLNPAHSKDQQTLGALERIADSIRTLQTIPTGLHDEVHGTYSEILGLVLQEALNQPLPERGHDHPVEIVGWLDCRLDDAPRLVVCGCNEGTLPAAEKTDSLLPKGLKDLLGLPTEEHRFARDLYSFQALLGSERTVHFIGGRRSQEGEPLRPSRLFFQAPPEELAQRMRSFLAKPYSMQVQGNITSPPVRELPRAEASSEFSKMSPTGFNLYLRSPYQFYLEKVLGLKTEEDSAQEMGPMQFGILMHDVLEDFGKNEEARSLDQVKDITNWLSDALDRHQKRRFGKNPLPTIPLQVEIMRERLRIFAPWQAKSRAEGWVTEHTEWETGSDGVQVQLGEETVSLVGKIDRIDFHPEQKRHRILDYKSWENPRKAPLNREGIWSDLQLPLYRAIAMTAGLTNGTPELGYLSLPKEAKNSGVSWSTAKLKESQPYGEVMESAAERAGTLLRWMRTGVNEDGNWAFEDSGKNIQEPMFAAIAGKGLLDSLDSLEEGS